MPDKASLATGDWCLFEVVQRLAFDKRIFLSFDLLEGMSLESGGVAPVGVTMCRYWINSRNCVRGWVKPERVPRRSRSADRGSLCTE